MYYKLLVSPLSDYGVVREPDLSVDTSFQAGGVITDALPEPLQFAADFTLEHPPTDYMGIVIPVLSGRLADELTSLGVDNLQLFDAVLENEDAGLRWEGYKACNVVGLVSCLAVEESQATVVLPPLHSFDPADLVIDSDQAGGQLFFRLAEAPRVLLMERTIGDRIMDASPEFLGLEFRDVEEV